MQKLKIYNERSIKHLLSLRAGELKLGEKIRFIERFEDLENTSAEFVLFGIPEDIGVRANMGKAGTSTAWKAFLKAFLNVQQNEFSHAENIILLGEIDTSEAMEKAGNIDVSDPNYHEKLGDLLEKIDDAVSEVVKHIISCGKIPLIIGGGHNNAFGNIKGASEAFGKAINVLNFDAHTDLRRTDYRHSGNGFCYAFKNGFLNKYSVFGLHQNYTPQYIFEEMKNSEKIRFSLFESLPEKVWSSEFLSCLSFIKEQKFGLELDCDAIANFPSSAVSPAGFHLEEVRKMLRQVAQEKNCSYLHICEAIALKTFPTGKALSYFINDFVKTRLECTNI